MLQTGENSHARPLLIGMRADRLGRITLNGEIGIMWRSLFIALGVFLCLLGAEFLACEHLVLRQNVPESQPVASTNQFISYATPGPQVKKKIYVPKDWMPWTLLASGATVLMYSVRPRL